MNSSMRVPARCLRVSAYLRFISLFFLLLSIRWVYSYANIASSNSCTVRSHNNIHAQHTHTHTETAKGHASDGMWCRQHKQLVRACGLYGEWCTESVCDVLRSHRLSFCVHALRTDTALTTTTHHEIKRLWSLTYYARVGGYYDYYYYYDDDGDDDEDANQTAVRISVSRRKAARYYNDELWWWYFVLDGFFHYVTASCANYASRPLTVYRRPPRFGQTGRRCNNQNPIKKCVRH